MPAPPDSRVSENPPSGTPRILVVGVGGAGLRAAAVLVASDLSGVRFAGVHTEARKLAEFPLETRILLGASLTRGLGAGGDPAIGKAAAEAEADRLSELCREADLVVVVAGMGKGTGSGAAPVVARLAREAGALVLAFAVLPFGFEGARRQRQAQGAMRQLKLAADAVVCMPNQQVASLLDENTKLEDTLRITNDLLAEGVRGIWRLITRDGLINVTFSDLCNVVRGRQAESCFAAAEATGESRAREAMDKLMASPMLREGKVIGEADTLLVSVVGGEDLRRKEIELVMEQIGRLNENAEIVMGASVEPEFEGRLAITLVAGRRGDLESASDVGAGRRGEVPPPAAEFPTKMEGRSDDRPTSGERGSSRYVPPPPELTPQVREQLIQHHASASPRQRKRAARMRQEMLPLEVVSKGRFAKSEPTIHRGEDLDTPTYIRKGIALN